MISYSTIVDNLKSSALGLTAVNTVGFGSIDMLDSLNQNCTYPLVFYRPLSSQGIRFSGNSYNMMGDRRLSFEMYILDVPKQDDTDFTDVLSNCEQIGYDILSIIYDGSLQDDYQVASDTIIPAIEAFQDRTAGWVFNIDIITDNNGITSCNNV